MRISVQTGCRLHLGMLDVSGDLGRKYGSVGVALKAPGFSMEVEESGRLEVFGPQKRRISSLVKKFRGHYKVSSNVRVEVKEEIPEHAGLGSGTQAALAIGAALSRLYGIEPSIEEIAGVLGRSKRSGIGAASFASGGFVVDSGFDLLRDRPPVPVYRRNFPKKWDFVVAVPKAEKGLSGKREAAAFKPGPASQSLSSSACRIVQLGLLPALVEEDIRAFGFFLSELDLATAKFFSSAQKKTFRVKASEKTASFMYSWGAYGVGQSSWGPAVYGLVESRDAKSLRKDVFSFMEQEDITGDVFVGEPDNSGAKIRVM